LQTTFFNLPFQTRMRQTRWELRPQT